MRVFPKDLPHFCMGSVGGGGGGGGGDTVLFSGAVEAGFVFRLSLQKMKGKELVRAFLFSLIVAAFPVQLSKARGVTF